MLIFLSVKDRSASQAAQIANELSSQFVQVIAELEALRATGLKVAFVVDDNLIGNKGAIKEVLREVVVWQKQHGYPFRLFTEASIDLADDAEHLARHEPRQPK